MKQTNKKQAKKQKPTKLEAKKDIKDIKKFVKDVNKELKIIDKNFRWIKIKDTWEPKTKSKALKVKEMEKIMKEVRHINKELKEIDPNFLWITLQKRHKRKFKLNREHIFVAIRRIIMISLSLIVLLVWLDLLKKSIVNWINIDFLKTFFDMPTKSFFLSYLLTEVTMSGSPIAGAFISLWDVLSISQKNLAAIIMWTRWWVNSFLLITWLLMLIKWKSLKRALWITVIQFLVTLSVTATSAIFIFSILKLDIVTVLAEKIIDWFVLNSFFDIIIWFFSENITHILPNPIITGILWLFWLVWWLFLFDRSFSFIAQWKDRRFIHKIVNVKSSFLAGFVITALTMSLSVSVAILMPLYVRKVINRKMLIAYILWANTSTLFDTLFLWVMSQSILGIKVITGFIIAVFIAVIILMAWFKYYQHIISYLTDRILKNKYRFLIFMIIVMLWPIVFLFF